MIPRLLILIPVLCLVTLPLPAQEKKITLLQEAVKVKANLRRVASSESKLASDHGYLANEHVVDCFAAMRYHYTGGRYVNEPINFRLRTPEVIEPGRKYPLIIYFHGAGESGHDNQRQLSHLQTTIEYLTGPRSLDFYMLALQCPADNRSWMVSKSKDAKGDAPLTILAEVLDALIEEYPIDTDAVSLFGICSGANGAWQFAMTYPERFASTVVCQSLAPEDRSGLRQLKNSVVWAFHSVNDGRFRVEPVEEMITTLQQAGGKAHLTKMNSGHDSWTRAMRDEHVVFWMTLQNRKQPGPPPRVALYCRSPGEHFTRFGLPVILIGLAGLRLVCRFPVRRGKP